MAQSPGWGFTVTRGATTVHEDSAAYEVSTSSWPMEMEAVTHALRWVASRGDSQTTHAFNEPATKSQKWNGSPDLAFVVRGTPKAITNFCFVCLFHCLTSS